MGNIWYRKLSIFVVPRIYLAASQLAPAVSREAVVSANPDAILISDDSGGFERWVNLASLKAARQQNIFKVNGKLLNRPTPRMLAAIADVCEQIDAVRRRQQLKLP